MTDTWGGLPNWLWLILGVADFVTLMWLMERYMTAKWPFPPS